MLKRLWNIIWRILCQKISQIDDFLEKHKTDSRMNRKLNRPIASKEIKSMIKIFLVNKVLHASTGEVKLFQKIEDAEMISKLWEQDYLMSKPDANKITKRLISLINVNAKKINKH